MIRTALLAVAAAALLPAVSAATAATAATAASAHPASGAAAHTLVIGNCKDAAYEPRKIISACADLNEYAVVTHWTSWTKHQARGSGRLVVNTCRPDCAAGQFRKYPATFSLHKVVKKEDGTRVFSKLGVTYVKGGEEHDVTLDLPTTGIIVS